MLMQKLELITKFFKFVFQWTLTLTSEIWIKIYNSLQIICIYFKKFYGISFVVLEEMDTKNRGFKNLNIKIVVYLIRDFKMQSVLAKFSRLNEPRT